MIKVTVEIWPFGDKDSKRVLGEMIIINDGTGSPEHGNYDIIVDEKKTRVEDFTRAHGSWALIYQALDNFKGELFHSW